MKLTKMFLVIITCVLCAVSIASAGSITAPAGYVCIDTPVNVPASGWFGGFDVLPNGNFIVSDSTCIREINLSGADVRTIYTFDKFGYGSFVRYNAANNDIYFGESTSNTIWSMPLSGGDASLIATLQGNYEMDFYDGVPYVVAGNSIYKLDEAVGSADKIATVGVNSGALAFDSQGNMIYGTGDSNWPMVPNSQNIYMWTAEQVASATGDGVLSGTDATIVAATVDAPSGFTMIGGKIYYTDNVASPGVLKVVQNGSADLFASTSVDGAYPWTTTLRYNTAMGGLSAAVSWSDANWNTFTVISTLVPVTEPSSALVLCSMIGLAFPAGLLRRRHK